MDPFSLTVGIVGLVDGGLSLSKELKDKIDNFRDAGKEVVELAHEIDLCTSLIDVLGNSLARPENAYPENVVKQTKWLVEDMTRVFRDIRELIADFDYSAQASALYVLNAEELKAHHAKLKSLQLSFVFMLSVCSPQRNDGLGRGDATNTDAPPAQLGSFEGTIQQMPIQIQNAPGSGTGTPMTYQATLILRPPPSGPGAPAAGITPDSEKPQQSMSERLEEALKDHELKKKLRNLSRSPFFSKDAFRDMLVKAKAPF